MSELEVDIFDELYFVKSFQALCQSLALPDEVLKQELENLYHKGWIGCYASPTKDALTEHLNFDFNYQKYYYLATKAGLLAHNTR